MEGTVPVRLPAPVTGTVLGLALVALAAPFGRGVPVVAGGGSVGSVAGRRGGGGDCLGRA